MIIIQQYIIIIADVHDDFCARPNVIFELEFWLAVLDWISFRGSLEIIILSIHFKDGDSHHVLTSCTALTRCLLRACSLWSYLLQLLRFRTAASIHFHHLGGMSAYASSQIHSIMLL